MKKLFLVMAALGLPFFLFSSLTSDQAAAKALFVSTALLWFFELLPLSVTGLIVPLLATVYGILPVNDAFSVFGNPILFLFLGSFLLARAMEKHQWDRRMIYFILAKKWISASVERVIIVFFLIAWILSFWISNTAACAVMVPMAVGLGNSLAPVFQNQKCYQNFMLRILLGTAFSASIGGVVTPIGSPPNLIAIHFLSEKAIHLGFLEWILLGLPVSLFMLIGLHLLLKWRYPIAEIQMENASANFRSKLRELGNVKIAEIQVAAVFFGAVFLWLLPGIIDLFWEESLFSKTLIKFLPMNTVALIAAIILFILPVTNARGEKVTNLEQADIKKISWDTLLIFAGGLCIGKVLDVTGLANDMGAYLFQLSQQNSVYFFSLMAILGAIILSELGSNTASASIIIPIILGNQTMLQQFGSENVKLMVFMVAVGASFGFMLPVSTPPNAIVYATGLIPLKEMKKTGVFFDILGFLIMLLALFILRQFI